MSSGESWGITLLVGLGILLALGLILAMLVRSLPTRSQPMRCPITGHVVVVQSIVGEKGQMVDVVACGAFPDALPVTCERRCLPDPDARPRAPA